MRKGKLLAGVLSTALVLGGLTLPTDVSLGDLGLGTLFAQAAETVASGTDLLGNDISWTLDDEGTLTISGSGEMTYLTSRGYLGYVDDIKKLVIGDGITVICEDAFMGLTSLESVEIADSVTTIGSGAFSNCTSLTSITLPDSVTTVGDGDDYDGSYTSNNGVFEGCTALTNVKLSSSMTRVGACMFYGCTGLTSLDMLEEGIVEIGADAFHGCTELTEFEIPDSVTTIEEGAFADCTGLTSVTIPATVTELSKSLNDCGAGYTGVFQRCTGITSLVIEDGVPYIGGDTFQDCTGLTSVTIPSSVKVIGGFAFDGCTNLRSVIISDGVEEIYLSAFYDCTSLKCLIIPASVTYIGQNDIGEGRNAVGFYHDSGEYIVDGFIIYGYSGTEAETYANDTGITFVDLDALIAGDINHDGEVNYLDAMAALRYDAELIDLTDVQLSVGDVNDDGSVNSLDAILILRYDAGLITSF